MDPSTLTDDDITTTVINGRLSWLFPNGRTMPVVRGGFTDDGFTDDGGGGDDTGSGNATGDDKEPPKDPTPNFEADAKKWKAIALKHEAAARANSEAAARLKELELEGKSETEKLQLQLNEARAEAAKHRVAALKGQIAAEKGLPPALAKFLPDVDNEVDMMAAADELLDAAGPATGGQPTRQPKSNLLNPLHDDDPDASRDQLIAAMQGRAAL